MIVSCVWVVGMGGVFGFNWISYDEFELVGGGWTDVVMYSFINFFVGVSGSTRIHVELGRYSFWIYTVLYNCHLVHTSLVCHVVPLCSPPPMFGPPDGRIQRGWGAAAARMPRSTPSSVSR
jgi:hypothetical protein